jgi:hypothetical protein
VSIEEAVERGETAFVSTLRPRFFSLYSSPGSLTLRILLSRLGMLH